MFACLRGNGGKGIIPIDEFKKVRWPHILDRLDSIIVEIEFIIPNITRSFLLYIL